MKYTIGIDMGINNVGWSVIDDKNNLIDYGVRLFSQSKSAEDRRASRNLKRRMKRRKRRINDTLLLMKDINFPDKIETDNALILKRYSGINKKIDKQDIVNILCFLVRHRGYIPYGDEEPELIKLNDKLPCEYFYDEYIKTGMYRNNNYTNENVRLEDNIKEIRKLFETQRKYYPELSKEVEEKYISIIKRKRKYWEGPGSVNSLTPYGRFKTEEDVEKYNKEKENNPSYEKYIYDDLIGKCSIAVGEKCAPKLNIYYELFNMYNDFINIRFKNIDSLRNKDDFYLENGEYKLNYDGIERVETYLLNNSKISSYKVIFKDLWSITIDNIEGYRMDKKGKPEFSTLKYYRQVRENFKENTSWIDDIDKYNEIIRIMTLVPGKEEFKDAIKDYNFNEDEFDKLNELRNKFKKDGMLSYGALSEKVLIRADKDMKNMQKNFMQVRRIKNYDREATEHFVKIYENKNSNKLHLNVKLIDDIVASPQVKKSLRQSEKIINAVIDKYGIPEVIAVESTKEMNGKERKKEIEAEQKLNELKRKNAIKIIEEEYDNTKVTESNITKVMAYEETNGHCIYCNKPISINDVISANYEIEHILPLSKSSDDSFNNKTISCSECNRKKLNKTPYQFLINNFSEFKERVENNSNLSISKKENLLFTGDIDKYSIRFINRNLRDTAYATKELINQIRIFDEYLKVKNKSTYINTLSTPGELTHKLRLRHNLEKNRDDGKYHHAVDASIVASIANTNIGKLIIDMQNNKKFWEKSKVDDLNLDKLINNLNIKETIDAISKINNDNTKLSVEVIKDVNNSLSNANIIKSIKKEDTYYKVQEIKNIYNLDNSDINALEKLFNEDDNTLTLMIYDNDKKTYNYLKEIYLKYKNEKGNPFINYLIDKGEIDKKETNFNTHGIRAITKNGNGPIIKKLRYYQKVSSPYILKDKQNQKEDTINMLDGLSQYFTRVYYDIENKNFLFLPIYSISINFNTKKIKENDKYYKENYKRLIGDKKVEKVCDLFNGNIIEVTKKDESIHKGIFMCYHKSLDKICLKDGSYFTKNDKALTIYDTDILGNEKKRLTFRVK